MRIVVNVVCCNDGGDHSMLADSIKNTWGLQDSPNFRIFYTWAKNYKKKHENDIVINTHEGYHSLLLKTIKFLEWYKEPYDYYVKVNTGSFLAKDRLISFLKNKPRQNFYCGIKGKYKDIKFASGSCMIISSDLASKMTLTKDKFDYHHIDDLAIGKWMAQNGIAVHPSALRITLHENGVILQKGKKVIRYRNYPHKKNYHWRLRSDDKRRFYDCQSMRFLYDKIILK